ncbi:MAG: LysM domain-containing protein [Alphaproteobacteria bacterium]|nr:LysM domain-containing protein [Alphaproteobacteria bacterium]
MSGAIDNFVASGGTSGALTQPNSRYNGLGTASYTRADGTEIRYLQRRIIPQPDQFTTLRQYVVVQGDRIDNVANLQMGDPLLYWILCDANAASDPDALVAEPGRVLRITLPAGVGAAGGSRG